MNLDRILKELTRRERSLASLRNLQEQAFASKMALEKVFPNHFVIDSPADGVGGDWYNAMKVGEKRILIVADSVGHSLEGAAGSLALHAIISDGLQRGILDPKDLISFMHKKVAKYFRHQLTCDLGIVALDENQVIFSGAKRPAIIHQGERDHWILPANRISIGQERGERVELHQHTIAINPGARVFITSDGAENALNRKGARLGSKRVRRLIVETSILPLLEQKTTISNYLNGWINGAEREDDILVVGVEL